MPITKAQAIANLKKLASEGRALLATYESDRFTRWWYAVRAAAAGIFGDDSRNLKELEGVRFTPIMFTSATPDSYFNEVRDSGINSVVATLDSMVEEVAEYFDDDDDEENDVTPSEIPIDRGSSDSVFVVHGHDNEAKEAVARFLTQLGIRPIILHERPNMGRTIIEKLEANSAVGFAVVLLTPDDVGANSRTPELSRPRARQNVVLELGLFIGLLGRGRVCALRSDDIELPSDYSGVIYIPFDSGGGWKLELVRELKSAGFSIDANKAFQ